AVGFDRDGWLTLAQSAETAANRLLGELDALAPSRSQGEMFASGWKWDSPKDVAEALKAVGCSVEATNDNALAALDHPLAQKLRDYRAARKLASTYGAGWIAHAPIGRIHAGWRQLGANSGRMACTKPNLQNLPRDPR